MRLRLAVLLDQGQDAHRRVVLGDQLALRRQAFKVRQHPLATVRHMLDLILLCRLRDRDPQHGLVGLEALQRQPQRVPAKHQHGPRPGTLLLRTGAIGKRGGEHLATRRTPQLLHLIADG